MKIQINEGLVADMQRAELQNYPVCVLAKSLLTFAGVLLLLMMVFPGNVLATRVMTDFNPVEHGFKFANDFKNVRYIADVDRSMGGRCGGMIYSVLDYYLTKTTIPSTNQLPTDGTPLSTYISARHEDSLVPNLDKWAELVFNPGGSRTSEFWNWGLQGYKGGRLQELRSYLDRGIPVPLGLFHESGGNVLDGVGNNHVVLAIGYDMGRYKGDLGQYKDDLRIFIYDPNHPTKMITMRPDSGNQRYFYENDPDRAEHPRKNIWLTYFVDKRYKKKTPRTEGVLAMCSGRNVAGQKLTGRNFTISQGNYQVAKTFRCAKAARADFTGSTIVQQDFYKADLQHAIFHGAALRNTGFTDSNAERANFYGADLKGARFDRAKLYNADFYGADLKGASLSDARANNARFYGADLATATINSGDFSGANFQGASLNTVDAAGAKFKNANLKGANLSNANLSGADFTGAKISPQTNFQGANLEGAIGLSTGNTAGSSTAALTSSSSGSSAISCAASLQGKIAWDYTGGSKSKQWMPQNIRRLCKGAENSPEPARCFNKIMHGGVNWGGSTQWNWRNAMDLCEGSRNAQQTVACFVKERQKGKQWDVAIKLCGK